MKRFSKIVRSTNETQIEIELVLDGKGETHINTGIGFLDHMLDLMCFHGNFDLNLKADGDLHVDDHHTVEDIGLCLGQSFKEALGEKNGIRRYGNIFLPMDETLARVVTDISNRAYLVYKCDFNREKLGTLDTQNIKEFFRSFSSEAGITLHMEVLYGENEHHKAEALFKGFGRCLKSSIEIVSDVLPSTKGAL